MRNIYTVLIILCISISVKAQYLFRSDTLANYNYHDKFNKVSSPYISPDGEVLIYRAGKSYFFSRLSSQKWSEPVRIEVLENLESHFRISAFDGRHIFLFGEGLLLMSELSNDQFSIPEEPIFTNLPTSQISAWFGNGKMYFFDDESTKWKNTPVLETEYNDGKWSSPVRLPDHLSDLYRVIPIGTNGMVFSKRMKRKNQNEKRRYYFTVRKDKKWSLPVILNFEGVQPSRLSSYCERTNELFFMANDSSDHRIYTSKLPEVLLNDISFTQEFQSTNISKIDQNSPRKTEIEIESPKFFALLIGIEDYKFNDANLADLSNPIKDAEELKNELVTNYSFEEENTTVLKNPSRAGIINAFEEISKVLTEKDNLLVFYAGHGFWDKKLNIGYWLPSDATESKSNWISNSTIRDYIAGLNTKHTLLISDACFSGSIFKTREVGKSIDDYGYYRLNKLPSRKAMTSGTLNTVPDDSKFMKYLLKALSVNEKEYFPSKQLFHEIEIAIINNTANVPQFGTIQNTGDEGGDFIFIKKEKE